MPRSQATPEVGESLGYLLKHAQQRYQTIQRPALAAFGLDGRLLAVLVVVGREGPALQQRLAERLGVDRTTMVALIDALELSQLVKRRRDPADRRGQLVLLTAKGTKLLPRALEAVAGVEDDFLAGLSSPEQREFRRLLAKAVTG
ncbi:MAG TPA: MarR family transcriptional regulator [Solirubrobacteraceae bacterium]|nr:MarR family transcriptional regulator [Solirubrobacteraceae bacterium]